MNISKFLKHQALVNGVVAFASICLLIYLGLKFGELSSQQRSAGTGIIMLIAILVFFVASLIYLMLMILMMFRYREDLTNLNTKLVRRLYYENKKINLKIVLHNKGLWLTN